MKRWIDVEREAQRPWRGLPNRRGLDSADLSWFKTMLERSETPFWRSGPNVPSKLGNELRRVYDQCSKGGKPAPLENIIMAVES